GRRRNERVEAAEGVEDRQMGGWIEQRVMLVLAVQLDEPGGQILERSSRRERSVDEGAAASLCGDFAANEHLLVPALEDGFDRCGIFTGPDEVARRAAAQEQPHGLDQDGLPRAGLTGQNVQAGPEFNLDGVDDREVIYFEKAEHEKRENSNRSIGLTAILRVCYCVQSSRCPSGAQHMLRRPVCARLEGCPLPCWCRLKALPRPTPARVSSG